MNDYKGRLETIKSNVLGRAVIVAVSKYSTVSQIRGFLSAGHKDFGENRVDVLMEKNEELNSLGIDLPHWHFIGKIQSNKINKLYSIENLKALHSVDTLKLLKNLILKSDKIISKEPIDLFLQINISGEKEKSGFENFEELKEAYEYGLNNSSGNLRLRGIMAMGRMRTDDFEVDAKKSFKLMEMYREKLCQSLENELNGEQVMLSMGMSADYELALDCGANYIRLGRTFFFNDH